MPIGVVGSSASYPQTGANRTRESASIELASFVGGPDDADVQSRCALSWDAAVREYNSVAWKFCRVRQSITLTATDVFALESDFRSPLRAVLLDSNSKVVNYPIEYVPYPEWLDRIGPNTGTGSMPQAYTARDTHISGQVLIWPTLGSTITYPTLRLDYHRWISLVGSGVLNVSRDVDEGIFQLAMANQYAKARGAGHKDSIAQKSYAMGLRNDLERIHRDWPDYGPAGGWQ